MTEKERDCTETLFIREPHTEIFFFLQVNFRLMPRQRKLWLHQRSYFSM